MPYEIRPLYIERDEATKYATGLYGTYESIPTPDGFVVTYTLDRGERRELGEFAEEDAAEQCIQECHIEEMEEWLNWVA